MQGPGVGAAGTLTRWRWELHAYSPGAGWIQFPRLHLHACSCREAPSICIRPSAGPFMWLFPWKSVMGPESYLESLTSTLSLRKCFTFKVLKTLATLMTSLWLYNTSALGIQSPGSAHRQGTETQGHWGVTLEVSATSKTLLLTIPPKTLLLIHPDSEGRTAETYVLQWLKKLPEKSKDLE